MIYQAMILSVVVYESGTWFLTLSDEVKFRVFENEVLRVIYVCIQDEDSGELRPEHNDELLRLTSRPVISHRLRSAKQIIRMG